MSLNLLSQRTVTLILAAVSALTLTRVQEKNYASILPKSH